MATTDIAQVGDLRTFSFSTSKYQIREIIDQPNFTLTWTWTSGVCSHCKRIQERIINHEMYRIEVLVKEDQSNTTVNKNDLLMMGYTMDKLYMQIPMNQYDTLLTKSNVFKQLI